jgi:preprotein translocase subunit SecA
MQRIEHQDLVYRTEEEKFRNAAKELKTLHEKGQPVLVGTISVEKSERLSSILKKMGVRHEVLNAKNHEREASIVAQAGRKGAVTVSTNMAGRGTDILLGGNPEVMARESLRKQSKDPDIMITTPAGKAEWEETLAKFKAQTDKEHDEVIGLGGLHILGTERHESRRIDNQLRGRAGRQGDPGSSRFYLSLQDDLLRIFGGDRMQNLMLRLGMEEDVPIESGLITKRIASAQQAVEVQNFESRKHLLEYDDVMNKQRTAVYKQRRDLLEGTDQKEHVLEMTRGALAAFIDMRCPEGTHPSTFDFAGLRTDLMNQFGLRADNVDFTGMSREQIEEHTYDQLVQKYQQKEDLIGSDIMRQTERMIMLQVVDDQWKDHLLSMDHLKEGIGLRGYGQKDPLVEYKKESFTIFQDMMDRIEDETVRILFTFTFEAGRPQLPFEAGDDSEYEEEEPPLVSEQERQAAQAVVQDFTRKIERDKNREMQQLQFLGGGTTATVAQPIIKGDKVGRNDPCPCGSGKKYKKCHGAEA